MTSAGQKGRAASWTSTASPSIAARPARTESERSAPPSISSPTSRPLRAAFACSSCPLPTTTRADWTAGWRSSDSTAQRSTGFPPRRRYCLGTPPPPIREPFPAATMRAVVLTSRASRTAVLVRQGLFPYLPPSHEQAHAHQDRPDRGRIVGHPGADDGRHRPAVPAGGE